jgi:TolB-like protein/Tfp pilus assembly protein PilF
MEATLERHLPEHVHAQLARILASDAFRRSPSLGRFLNYLVDRALSGELESIKEYRLGLEVFDRGDDFDPRDDTIVRVQARNLRTRLDAYFESPSPSDTIRFVLPKGGYQLHFEAIAAEPVPLDPLIDVPLTPPPVKARRAVPWLAAIVTALAIAILAARYFPRPAPGDVTLFVAPFANLSADKDNEYFAGGLTEELTDALAKLPGLRVVARTSSRVLDLASLRQLGIENVVEGSVRKDGSKVRISVRLLNASSGANLWSHVYDREIQDSLVTEQEIASAIAATLKLRFAPHPVAAPVRTPNAEAYDLYLKGRYSWRRYDPPSALEGISYLERSIALDPGFAPAYVALAGCYGTLGIFYRIPPVEAFAKVREMSLKALELDDTIAEAHTLLGGVYAWNDWNWERGEWEYRSGAQLDPQSVIAHQYYASLLGSFGRQQEAQALMREATRLDPLDSLAQWGDAQLMYWRGEYPQALAALNKIARREPDFGLTAQLTAQVDWALGKDEDAQAVLRERLARHPQDPIPLGELGYALAKAGRPQEARDILKTLDDETRTLFVPPQAMAFVFIGLHENDKAMTEVRRALDYRTLRPPWLKIEPMYAPLRSHPLWAELLHHVNLE